MLINASKSSDARLRRRVMTEEELLESSVQHISDVKQGMAWLAGRLLAASNMHDFTKVLNAHEFHRQFERFQKTGKWGRGWYDKIHIVKERHHLRDRVPDDVDLIDVLEMVVDGVMAGLARTGRYTPDEPNPELLVKAYKNMARKIADMTQVVGVRKTRRSCAKGAK